ncbi:MAG: DUF177 domain-containing protein [Proteobacteria bacterium]|nr:DUF177 domain-containing protein [Pseudomonadota bacterium]MCH8237036.1 DUF177 domain-containing protein [Pseudomonadota bacterium]
MTPPTVNLSHPVSLPSISEGGTAIRIEADAAERARLSECFGLLGLDSLAAELRLTAEEGGTLFHLEGTMVAEVIQACGVTLEPLKSRIEAPIYRQYTTAEEGDPEPAGEDFDIDAEEPPEQIIDGKIDVGEAVAEQLALELSPFPRKTGIDFADYSTGPENSDVSSAGGDENTHPAGSPFAALTELRKKLK